MLKCLHEYISVFFLLVLTFIYYNALTGSCQEIYFQGHSTLGAKMHKLKKHIETRKLCNFSILWIESNNRIFIIPWPCKLLFQCYPGNLINDFLIAFIWLSISLSLSVCSLSLSLSLSLSAKMQSWNIIPKNKYINSDTDRWI